MIGKHLCGHVVEVFFGELLEHCQRFLAFRRLHRAQKAAYHFVISTRMAHHRGYPVRMQAKLSCESGGAPVAAESRGICRAYRVLGCLAALVFGTLCIADSRKQTRRRRRHDVERRPPASTAVDR